MILMQYSFVALTFILHSPLVKQGCEKKTFRRLWHPAIAIDYAVIVWPWWGQTPAKVWFCIDCCTRARRNSSSRFFVSVCTCMRACIRDCAFSCDARLCLRSYDRLRQIHSRKATTANDYLCARDLLLDPRLTIRCPTVSAINPLHCKGSWDLQLTQLIFVYFRTVCQNLLRIPKTYSALISYRSCMLKLLVERSSLLLVTSSGFSTIVASLWQWIARFRILFVSNSSLWIMVASSSL